MSSIRGRTAGLLIGLALCGCARHHVKSVEEPYLDRGIWIQPTMTCTDSSPRLLPPVRVSDTLSGNYAKGHNDRLMARLARQLPGGWAFGPGVDSSRRWAVWLRDTAQKSAAIAALDLLAPPTLRFLADHHDAVIVHQARWDYAELFDWVEYLRKHAEGTARGTGINMSGIDSRNNRIVFGIETRESLPRMVSWLVESGIPCRLVVVELIGPVRLLSQPASRPHRLTVVAADERDQVVRFLALRASRLRRGNTKLL